MKFVFEGKEFDDDSLSNECKINVSKIQNILEKSKDDLTNIFDLKSNSPIEPGE